MISEAQLQAIALYIQTVPELRGCRVGHYGWNQSQLLHPGNTLSPNYSILVVIDEYNIQSVESPDPALPPPAPTPEQITNESRVGSELIGVGLSCGLVVVSGVGFVGALAAEGPSLGTSTFLAVAAWAGMATGYAQCLNAIYRTSEAVANPHDNSLELLDNNSWYTNTFFVIDAIGILSGLASINAATRAIRQLLRNRAALPSDSALRAMNRAQRNTAMREAIRRASSDPAARRELVEALQEAFPDRNIAAMIRSGGSAGTIRTGGIVSNVINEQIARSISSQIREILLSTAGAGVSATPSSWTGSGSGSLNTIGTAVINIIQSS